MAAATTCDACDTVIPTGEMVTAILSIDDHRLTSDLPDRFKEHVTADLCFACERGVKRAMGIVVTLDDLVAS